jgi:predicted PurR-regulated permease PerM
MIEPRQDLARTTLAVLFIGGLILAAFWVLRPFIGSAIWAATIVVATWPVMRRIQARLWHRRLLAVVVMTLALLMLFIVPITLGIVTLIEHVDEIGDLVTRLSGMHMSTPPDWLVGLPLVGPKIAQLWVQAAEAGAEGLVAKLTPYAGQVTRWFVGEVGTVGFLLVQSLLVVVLSALMYAQGETAAVALLKIGRRLGGHHGEAVVVLASQAIRGVALGVGVTAVVQSVLGGIGLAIAGVPYAGLLTVVMFIFCIAQLGRCWCWRRPWPGCTGAVTAAGAPSCWWSPAWSARSTTCCARCSSAWGPTCRCC